MHEIEGIAAHKGPRRGLEAMVEPPKSCSYTVRLMLEELFRS